MCFDSSGSMTGLRLEFAKATVRKIIDTLSDDDFFNVITVSVVMIAKYNFPEFEILCVLFRENSYQWWVGLA